MYSEYLNKTLLEKCLLLFFCSLPVSFIIGSLVLNINLILFDCLIIYFLFKNKKILFNNQKYFILNFIILILLSLIISDYKELSIIGTAGIIKNFIFFLGISLIIQFEDIKKLFSLIVLTSIIFVSLNIFLQFFFTEDLFGNKMLGSFRSTAAFGDQIPGSFILKFFFIGLLLKIFHKNFKAIIIYFIIFSAFILLTNERMSMLNIMLFSIFFILAFPKEKMINKISAIIILIIVWVMIFSIPLKNNSIQNYDKNLYEQMIDRSTNQFNNQTENNRYIFNIHWFQHFKAAYEIFVSKPILGSGIKTFRAHCPNIQKIKPKNEQLLCSTHPHNIYFEIISDTGLIGLGLLIFSMFYILKRLIIIFFKIPKMRNYTLIVIFPFLMVFNPIQFMGSFFSTLSGFFYFLILGIVLNYINYNYSNIKNENFNRI